LLRPSAIQEIIENPKNIPFGKISDLIDEADFKK